MKNLYLLLFFILITQMVWGQEEEDFDPFPPKIILKFSPINIVDFNTPGITFSLEHKIDEDRYLHHEINYLSDLGYNQFSGQPLIGFRLRTGYRYYYRQLYDDGSSNPFLEFLIKFKQTYQKQTTTFSRFDGLFFEELDTRIRTTSVGLYAAWGRQYYIGNRLTLEWGATLGWRMLQKQSLDVPADAEAVNLFGLLDLGEGTHNFPSSYLIFKLGYVLK